MSLFSHESKRDEKDINEIFCLIYSELTSLHQSNEPLRIFLQYFIPLFDIALGAIVFKKNSINPIVTYPIYQNNGLIVSNLLDIWSFINGSNQSSKWIDLNNTCAQGIIEKYSTINAYNIKDEVKSFCIIPIKIIGCIKNANKDINPFLYFKEIGNFILFSRLFRDQFLPSDKFLKLVQDNITASFLEPSERLDFLYGNEHKCVYTPRGCNGKGIGPLNNSGIFLYDWYENQ